MTDLIHKEASFRKLNRFFLFLIIPVSGILIPRITGIIPHQNYDWWRLLSLYALFIITAMLIWKGNVALFRRIRRQYEQQHLAYFRMLFYHLLANLLYSCSIATVYLVSWKYLSGGKSASMGPLLCSILVVITGVMLINSVYELILLRREMEQTIIRYKKMEIAKMHAELEALKAQIDPHFVFNSLNTLSYLITSNPSTARYYNETLARVYRYILMNKNKDLVFLKDELEFIRNYFYLIKIRFEEAVTLDIDMPDGKAEEYLITPISLQMLIENAIKHNHFSVSNPLVIRINMQSCFIIVRNRIKRKTSQASTSGIGLKNLMERYQIIMKKNIVIDRNNDEFLVKVPVIKA